MDKIESFIEIATLPIQLKDYFRQSRNIKLKLSEALVTEIEDLYIHYKSLYFFDETIFSECVIISIKGCKTSSNFYFYLRKVLNNELEIISKDEEFINYKRNNITAIKSHILESVFKEASIDFMGYIDILYIKDTEIEVNTHTINQIYKSLGKLELINDLVDDTYYDQLMISGKNIMEKVLNKVV